MLTHRFLRHVFETAAVMAGHMHVRVSTTHLPTRHARLSCASNPCRPMKSSTSTILAALLVAVVLATPTAAASSRRMLLGTCEDDCSKTYEDNVKKCIADTKLGEPPAIAKADVGKADMFVDYVPPTDTGRDTMGDQAHDVCSHTSCMCAHAPHDLAGCRQPWQDNVYTAIVGGEPLKWERRVHGHGPHLSCVSCHATHGMCVACMVHGGHRCMPGFAWGCAAMLTTQPAFNVRMCDVSWRKSRNLSVHLAGSVAHPAGFQLAEKECRRLQDPELQKCKAACNKKDCNAIVKKCNDAFNEGSMLAAWCSKKEGC